VKGCICIHDLDIENFHEGNIVKDLYLHIDVFRCIYDCIYINIYIYDLDIEIFYQGSIVKDIWTKGTYIFGCIYTYIRTS
jgi:hypothetical protein